MPLLAEQQILNLTLQQKDWGVIVDNGLDVCDKKGIPNFFPVLGDVYQWIVEYRTKNKGQLPTPVAVSTEFEDFPILTDLDAKEYLLQQLREDYAFRQVFPELEKVVKLVNEGDAIGSLNFMRQISEDVLSTLSIKGGEYDWARDAMKRYEEYVLRHGQEGLLGLATGIPKLDELTAGWRKKDYILITARLGNGKSWWGLDFALQPWKKRQDVDFYALEMDEDEVGLRLDTMYAHWDNKKLQTGQLSDGEMADYREYCETLSGKVHRFRVYTTEHNGNRKFTPDDIRARIERNKCSLVVIDQLSKMDTNKSYKNIREKFLTISGEIRQITLDTGVPIILLVQAGRESAKEMRKSEKASVEIDQIAESDAMAQDATRVLSVRKLKTDEEGYVLFKLSLKKNRGGEEDVDIYIRWHLNTGIMEEVSEDEMVF